MQISCIIPILYRRVDVHVHAALSHADGHDGAGGDTWCGYENVEM